MFRNLYTLILVTAACHGGVPVRAQPANAPSPHAPSPNVQSAIVPLANAPSAQAQPANVPSADQSAKDQSAVLILRNGNVLTGEISRVDDRYVVKLPMGEMRVPAGQVELLCRDLESAYHLKQTSLRGNSAAEHLELARWCLHHKLLEYAADEIRAARNIEPNQPRLGMLEKLLALSRQSESSPDSSSKSPPPPRRRIPTAEELDAMVRTLPEETIETFTTLVQPVLLNNCATSGCHGQRDTNHLRLERAPARQHDSQRPTQRNLHAVLNLVRRDDPARSPLLTYPLRAHGGADTPVFTADNADQYRRIAEWVQRLADPNAKNMEVAGIASGSQLPAAKANLLQPPTPADAVSLTSANGKLKEVTPAATEMSGQLQQPSSVLPANYEQATPEPVTQSTSAPATGRPAAATDDPFDPEVFNRQRSDGPSQP